VLFVALVVAGLAGVAPAAAAVGATICFVLAVVGGTTSLHQRTVVAIGSQHPWRREQVVAAGEVGHNEHRRVRLQITGSRWVHEAGNGISNSRTLLEHDQLEVCGDPSGRMLARIPGETRVRLLRPVY
jgi:hypothetical protein